MPHTGTQTDPQQKSDAYSLRMENLALGDTVTDQSIEIDRHAAKFHRWKDIAEHLSAKLEKAYATNNTYAVQHQMTTDRENILLAEIQRLRQAQEKQAAYVATLEERNQDLTIKLTKLHLQTSNDKSQQQAAASQPKPSATVQTSVVSPRQTLGGYPYHKYSVPGSGTVAQTPAAPTTNRNGKK